MICVNIHEKHTVRSSSLIPIFVAIVVKISFRRFPVLITNVRSLSPGIIKSSRFTLLYLTINQVNQIKLDHTALEKLL